MSRSKDIDDKNHDHDYLENRPKYCWIVVHVLGGLNVRRRASFQASEIVQEISHQERDLHQLSSDTKIGK